VKPNQQSHIESETEIHSKERLFSEWHNLSESVAFFLISFLAVTLEFWLTRLWLEKAVESWGVLASHLSIVLFLGLWSWFLHRQGRGYRLPSLLTIFTGFMGPFGTAGILLTSGFYFWFKKSSTPFTDWYASLFPEVGDPKADKLFDSIISGRSFPTTENSIVSFMDILNSGTTRQKQSMIVLLINRHHGKFAQVLKKALEDEDNSVRVLAAKGMAKIENQFMNRNLELEKLEEENQTPDSILLKSIIQNYDEYIYSGILDEILESEYRNRTIKLCREYLDRYPEDLDIRFILGRLLVRGRRNAEAVRWFEKCIENGFKSSNIFIWYFECLYRMGQFKKLRKQSTMHFEELEQFKQDFQPDVFEVLRAWSGHQNESLADFQAENTPAA